MLGMLAVSKTSFPSWKCSCHMGLGGPGATESIWTRLRLHVTQRPLIDSIPRQSVKVSAPGIPVFSFTFFFFFLSFMAVMAPISSLYAMLQALQVFLQPGDIILLAKVSRCLSNQQSSSKGGCFCDFPETWGFQDFSLRASLPPYDVYTWHCIGEYFTLRTYPPLHLGCFFLHVRTQHRPVNLSGYSMRQINFLLLGGILWGQSIKPQTSLSNLYL